MKNSRINRDRIIGVIPARYGSSRFEGKVLADIAGKPMIQWVYERAKKSKTLDELLVAVDDPRVQSRVEGFGGKAILTGTHHESGTDRIAEVVEKMPADIVVNIQGDQPLIDPNMIDEAVGPRGRWAYAYKELIDAGVPLILSSDAPVGDPSPLLGIHAAVTRQRWDGTPEGGWYPEQRISVDSAVRGYTTVPASFYGQSHELGTITPGKRADMIVLDKDIYQVDPIQIGGAKVEMTIFDGQIVFCRKKYNLSVSQETHSNRNSF